MRQRKWFLLLLLTQVLSGYINGLQIAKFELLIDRTLTIYPNVILKD